MAKKPGSVTGLAAEFGLSPAAVNHLLDVRDVRFTGRSEEKAKRQARRVIEEFLTGDRDGLGRKPQDAVAELLDARNRRRVERLIASLAAAGVAAESTKSGRAVIVEGQRVSMPPPRARWDHDAQVQRVAHEALGDRLLRGVLEHLSGLPLRAVNTPDGVVLARADRVVARVTATRAILASRTRAHKPPAPLAGNFLAPGRHWNQLAEAIGRAMPQTSSGSGPADDVPAARSVRILRELPASIAPELAELATIASQLIREDRTVAFGHAVELHVGAEVVRFDPIRLEGTAVEAPFVHRTAAGEMRAAIRLRSPKDPMAIAVEHVDDDRLVAHGWVTALVAFADLTCVPQAETTGSDAARPRRAGEAVGRVSSRTRAVRHGQTMLADSLQPSRETEQLMASYVVGHRRRLRPGQRPSPEAVRLAERSGISLRPLETWVRPHLRGAPDDVVLSFAWTPPEALGRLAAVSSSP